MRLVAPRHVRSSQIGDGTCVPVLLGKLLTTYTTGGAPELYSFKVNFPLFILKTLNMQQIWRSFTVNYSKHFKYTSLITYLSSFIFISKLYFLIHSK